MTILIAGTLRIGDRAAAQQPIADLVAASRAEAGCIAYAYADDVVEAGLMHISELWQSREALAAHARSAHVAHWRSFATALQLSDRRLGLYEVGDAEPI